MIESTNSAGVGSEARTSYTPKGTKAMKMTKKMGGKAMQDKVVGPGAPIAVPRMPKPVQGTAGIVGPNSMTEIALPMNGKMATHSHVPAAISKVQ